MADLSVLREPTYQNQSLSTNQCEEPAYQPYIREQLHPAHLHHPQHQHVAQQQVQQPPPAAPSQGVEDI